MFRSEAKQDQFVANMFNHKRDGYYIDIGSCGAIDANNTYFFESLGWKGICIEIESSYNNTYVNRSCHYLNENALRIDYSSLFKELGSPNSIDYLSIDIDEISYDALILLPFDEYDFKIITIEHDLYLRGEVYKNLQKEFLISKGYTLICENVYVEQDGYYGKKLPFEDWWICPKYFDLNLIDRIRSNMEYPSEIISKF